MAIKKDSKNLKERAKKAATSSGKPSAPQGKFDKSKRPNVPKSAKKLVHKMAHSVENMLVEQPPEQVGTGKEPGTNRFRATDKKSIIESVGLLAEEIRIYMEENEEIGVSKLLGILKNQGNSEAMIFAAMGWLIRDSKITISPDGKKISLQ